MKEFVVGSLEFREFLYQKNLEEKEKLIKYYQENNIPYVFYYQPHPRIGFNIDK